MIEFFETITPSDEKWYYLENLSNEVWKPIDEYENLYEISNYSRIKSLSKYKHKKIMILKPTRDNYNRYYVTLYKNGKGRKYFVHRLVAKTFIPNPDNKPEINHINPVTKDLCDNRVCNLEWATSKENSQWTIKLGHLYKPWLGKFGKDNNKSKPIVRLDTHGNLIDRWENAREIQRTLGIDFRFVSRCCNHKCKTAHGYIFMFEGEYDDK